MRPVRLRPLRPEDVPAAAAAAVEALPVPPERADAQRAWSQRRIAHLQATDPDGAWAAEEDGEVIGVGLGVVRDGIWGLSLLAVRPDRHARGAGRLLLEATLRTAGDARGALIASSTDPKAMRLYARAGFDLRPCVAAAGIPDRAALPAGLGCRPSEDVEAAAALSRPVRGGAYDAGDLALLVEKGTLLVVDGRGFAVHLDGHVNVLCATDEEAACDLLWSCLADAPRGATCEAEFLTAGQDWAVRTALAAGLALSPDGPMFTRGALGPLRPWLPSGSFL